VVTLDDMGKRAKDKISGIEGVIVGFTRYITGCDQYGLQFRKEEGKNELTTMWFDETRLDVTDNAPVMEPIQKHDPVEAEARGEAMAVGGPQPGTDRAQA